MNYHLLNGCPTVVLPVEPGSPLVAWDSLTLDHLYKIGARDGIEGEKWQRVVTILFEYVSLCVDWDRIVLPNPTAGSGQTAEGAETKVDKAQLDKRRKDTVRKALELVLVGAVQSKDCKEVQKKFDPERAGIVMFRIP
jgi:hypothetical protein